MLRSNEHIIIRRSSDFLLPKNFTESFQLFFLFFTLVFQIFAGFIGFPILYVWRGQGPRGKLTGLYNACVCVHEKGGGGLMCLALKDKAGLAREKECLDWTSASWLHPQSWWGMSTEMYTHSQDSLYYIPLRRSSQQLNSMQMINLPLFALYYSPTGKESDGRLGLEGEGRGLCPSFFALLWAGPSMKRQKLHC